MTSHALAFCLTLAAGSALADPVGLQLNKWHMPHHEARAGIAIWYPDGGRGDQAVFAENAVFHGVEVSHWAEVAEGSYPIVLFSHGMGGTLRAQAWLAKGLVARGAVVVSVNHPNTTWGDFDMADGVRHWTRAQDLQVALDRLLDDPSFAGKLDTSRVMAAGFSFGGWTALSIGGVTGNLAGSVATCEEHGATMSACDVLLSDRVNMAGMDPQLWNASYADPRVTHVAAIDPGFVWGLDAANVSGVDAQVTMIGFGAGEDRMSATDFDASGLADLLPEARIERIAPGFHFTAMPLCKPEGEAILRDDADDPVCTDPVGTNRAAVHQKVIDILAEELGL